MGAVLFVLALIFMIMFHEFGHYVTAKRFGMKVTEFFFGFGPRLWSTRPKVRTTVGGSDAMVPSETEYGVKAIPAGGYVKIVGMNPLEEVDPAEESRTFRGKPAGQKLVVLVAGSATHFLTGLVIFLLVFSVIGVRNGPPTTTVAAVPVAASGEAPTPAQQIGLQAGDRVVAVDGTAVNSWDELSGYIRSHGDQTVTFTVLRDGNRIELTARLADRGGVGFLGIVPDESLVRDPLPIGAWHSAHAVYETGFLGLKGLFSFFSPSSLSDYFHLLAGDEKKGPNGESNLNRPVSVVGAVQIGGQLTDVATWLQFFASIAVFVGFVNLLPLFPLDGGWVAVTIYEKVASRIRRRKVSVDFRKLVPLTYAVLAVFVFLFITGLYLDISNPFKVNL